MKIIRRVFLVVLVLILSSCSKERNPIEISNVSYDGCIAIGKDLMASTSDLDQFTIYNDFIYSFQRSDKTVVGLRFLSNVPDVTLPDGLLMDRKEKVIVQTKAPKYEKIIESFPEFGIKSLDSFINKADKNTGVLYSFINEPNQCVLHMAIYRPLSTNRAEILNEIVDEIHSMGYQESPEGLEGSYSFEFGDYALSVAPKGNGIIVQYVFSINR